MTFKTRQKIEKKLYFIYLIDIETDMTRNLHVPITSIRKSCSSEMCGPKFIMVATQFSVDKFKAD